MKTNQYIDQCGQRPVFGGIAVLIILVALSALVAVLMSILFGPDGEWSKSGVVGQWAGVLVAFVGFMLVLIQLHKETREIQNQTKWQVYSNGLTTLNVFVEHPELRTYFYDDNVPVPGGDPLKSQVFAAAEMLADHWESTLLSDDSLNADVNKLWLTYMLGVYCKSPALQEFLRDENEGYRYSGEFKNLLSKSHCEKMEEFRGGTITLDKLISGVMKLHPGSTA